MTRPTDDLPDFVDRARRHLEANYAPAPRADDGPFVWGRGSDELRVFQEPEPHEEVERLAAVKAWRRGLWDAGFGWITGPPELGGAGLSRAHQSAFDRLTRNYDVPGNGMLTVGLGMVAPTIATHGTDEQQRRYLPAIHRADLIGCQLFSEPEAGSDLASLRMSAVRDGDGWRLSGQKVWTSGAHLADIGEAICRTADGPRHRDLTAFVVDMHAPGVTVRPLRQMTGGAAFNEVFLDDVFVPDTDRLGGVGEGWRVALTTLGHERTAMGGESFGGAGLLRSDRLIALLHHVGRGDDAVARGRLADLLIHLRVARLTQQRAMAGLRASGVPGPEMSTLKLALSDNITRLAEFAAEMLGARLTADTGEWGTYAWNSVLLGGPGYRIGGGTDEILRNIIGEKVLGLPRDPRP